MNVTLDPEQQLYGIPCGDGHTCQSFQHAWDAVCQLGALLDIAAPPAELFGTLELYVALQALQRRYAQSPLSKATWFAPQTPAKVKTVLETLRKDRRRVRLWLGDPATGLAWLEEHDVLGTIGRSSGAQKVPLLVADGDGGAILTANILRIRTATTFKDLYRHPQFHLPELELRPGTDPRYPFELWQRHPVPPAEFEVYSHHRSYAEAAGLLAWLAGEEYQPDDA